jgi:hypothetical protein
MLPPSVKPAPPAGAAPDSDATILLGMLPRTSTTDVRSALLISALLAGGCGARMLGDAGAGPISGLDATANGDRAIDPSDGGVDIPNDRGGATDALPDSPADTLPAPDPSIYLATGDGVQRTGPTGGGFQRFGLQGATRSVFPSPSGLLVAQELADQRVAVFGIDNALRATFDIRPGLLGWSDEGTLLFLDPVTAFLQQTSIDGQTRRYLPLPSGFNASGYASAVLSPDRRLILAQATPLAGDDFDGTYAVVLSAADGTVVRYPGGIRDRPPVWTGDGRVLYGDPVGPEFLVTTPRTGRTVAVPGASALAAACAYATWYQTGKVLLGNFFTAPGSDVSTCVPWSVFDVDTGSEVVLIAAPSAFSAFSFAQSADGLEAATSFGTALELGAVTGGPRRPLGLPPGGIYGIGWAHPTGGDARLVAPPRPPTTAAGLAGAPSVASRSGGADCRTGVWVNRTPNPLPEGWPPAPRRNFSFAFDANRGTLLVEGGTAGEAGTLPNLDYETMEWDGARGQWTNVSRPDGFGPTGGRPMAYDARHKVVIALGSNLPGDGLWNWTPESGWRNLHSTAPVASQGPRASNAASVYDFGRDRWIVSGGYGETATWEWDGAVWQRSTAPPPGGTTQLAGAQLVYDEIKRDAVYSVGNRDRGASPWLYEPYQNRWTAQPSSGPSPLPRDWAGVAFDGRRDRVMVFGGFALNGTGGGTMFGDLSEWDPSLGAWQTCSATGAGPAARINAALAYDGKRDVLVLFGGDTTDGAAATEMWEWYVP